MPWSLAALALCALLLAACSKPPSTALQGYVEGEFVNVAAPAAGTLSKLAVRRGDKVAAGAVLFALDAVNEEAGRREAAERVRAADERLANLRAGRRPPEVAVTTAQAEQAEASRKLSRAQLDQQEKLFKSGYISQAALDLARANYQRDIARTEETIAQTKVAQLPAGRDAEIRAAQADAQTARAVLAQAEWRLSQRGAVTPQGAADALVQDSYFVEGEWVPAGRPVLSLLPPGNTKVRFFVPETRVGAIKIGDGVSISCDGCGAAIAATISFVSNQAEYTPPVIYSKDSRAKLVYMIEARTGPADAARLRPGQPVDVTLNAGASSGSVNPASGSAPAAQNPPALPSASPPASPPPTSGSPSPAAPVPKQ